jgi:predicted amidohydrolase
MDSSGDRLRLAIAQLDFTGDAHRNGERVRALMRDAAEGGARMIQFPEGTLSGYPKHQIRDWSEVDWPTVREEVQSVAKLAAELQVWVVLGSAHPLSAPNWPHNSLYVISDAGQVVARYDKRMCSATETTRFYSPGTAPLVFDVDGFRFGCLICIEINFPVLFMEYDRLGVDCVLLSAYPMATDDMFHTKALAHAAIHNVWIGLSVPTEGSDLTASSFIAPDGHVVSAVSEGGEGLAFGELNRDDPTLEIALHKARPWRASATSGEFHRDRIVHDVRSTNQTSI